MLTPEKAVNTTVSIVLAATPLYENIARRWVFYYMVRRPTVSQLLEHASNETQTGALGGISGLIMAWVNELTGYDNESTFSPRWCD